MQEGKDFERLPNGSVRLLKKKRLGFFRITQERWFKAWSELNPIQRSVLLSLWLRAGKECLCWPSERRLARELGISKTSVCSNLKILKEKGFLKVQKKEGRHNVYFLAK